MGTSHSLDDKYTAKSGAVFMSGTQALVRLPLVQMLRDQLDGLNTAGFITGYRGSPMGIYDQQLLRAKAHLDKFDIHFQPGVNEDLAATAIWGTQQVPIHKDAKKDGVLGIWYGKGPGVDRSGDVFRHGNAAGSAKHGGVLCIAGDDHSAKSSTVQHQSDHAFMSARMPMLYPSSVHEFIEMGLLGIAMSRYSGCWVGMKVISDTVETSAVVDLGNELEPFVLPDDFPMPENGLNIRWPDSIPDQDVRLHELKEKAALAFARANGIDQWTLKPERKQFGIVASGKAYEDARQALVYLGIDDKFASEIGLHLYKVRMPYPLEPSGIMALAEGMQELLVLEERREIIEQQLKTILYYQSATERVRVVGKIDEHGNHFLPTSATLSVSVAVRAIAERLLQLPLTGAAQTQLKERLAVLNAGLQKQLTHSAPIERKPWFCSGCPHNTSTRVPEGSKALAGIGCHYMVLWMDRNTETFTHMGAEGVPWTGIANYVEDDHRFVNIGDGTYFHSGLLAIRAAVASGVNITYKVLYNDAVAMTGGQAIDGGLTAEQITFQLKAEGVWPVHIVSDEPEQFNVSAVAPGVQIHHRDSLDGVMRELRDLKGCNAIVYVQTCAAEKRRRRRRGSMVDPDKRVVINADVCEGCGDCSVQSNCVSVEPLETPLGRKRRINQSSCNKDFSCINGFCPSFVTVTGAQLKKREAIKLAGVDKLVAPQIPAMSDQSWNVLVTGIGGTGVLTIGSLLGMAAHIDGHAAMVLDMTGLAQKGGAVISHVRLAVSPDKVTSAHIVPQGCDLLIAADAVVASSKQSAELLNRSRTHALVNTGTAPVADFVLHRDLDFGNDKVAASIAAQVLGSDHFHAFNRVAETLTGNAISTNILMLGYAWQQGLLPLSEQALREAITLNGVAVSTNLNAFDCGRLLCANPAYVLSLLNSNGNNEEEPSSREDMSLAELIEHRSTHLLNYQGKSLVKKYRSQINGLKTVVHAQSLNEELVSVLAHNYARVLSYKDEYEVARLFSMPSFQQQLNEQFEGDFKLTFNLAPPLLSGTAPNGRPKKRTFGPWVQKLFAVLQHGKRVRGTPLDVFGYTRERRSERRFLKQYEQDVARIISELNADNADIALQILALPDEVRGFGPVKHAAMATAQARRKTLWQEFDAPKPLDLTTAA